MSPDGMYYWDGQRWVTTLSPDGGLRWNGSTWEPVTGQAYAAVPSEARPKLREETSWTRPIVYAVTGWFFMRGVYDLLLPFWMSGVMSHYMQQTIQRQQDAYPPGAAPPAGFSDMMSSIMTGSLWFGALFGIALAVIAILGALKRWTWAYYVVLVLVGYGLLGFVYNLVDIAAGGVLTRSQAVQVPQWARIASYISGTVDAVLFAWMLVAVIRRGPWAMRRIY